MRMPVIGIVPMVVGMRMLVRVIVTVPVSVRMFVAVLMFMVVIVIVVMVVIVHCPGIPLSEKACVTNSIFVLLHSITFYQLINRIIPAASRMIFFQGQV
jgi:hypothetical protein